MHMFESSISVDRSQQDVFDYVSDPANDAQWQSGLESSELTSEGPLGAGSTSTVVTRFLGRRIEAITEITAWDPPNQSTAKTVNGPFPFEVTTIVEENGDGTLLTIRGQAEFGGFFKLAEGLVGKQLDKQIASDLAGLKLLLEAG